MNPSLLLLKLRCQSHVRRDVKYAVDTRSWKHTPFNSFSKKKYKQSSQLVFQIAMKNVFHGHIFNLQPNVLFSDQFYCSTFDKVYST